MFFRGGIFIGNSGSDGNSKIWLDDLRCKGSERTLVECRRTGWGIHDCHHSEDVWIRCDNYVRAETGNKMFDIENNLF